MRRLRVLVVDDSVVVRRVVSSVLATDPDIEVVGAAANGRLALARLTQLNPDAVTLDIEMPEMDGLETLTELRKTHPRLPVIMFSTLTERGAAATLEALARGASDYVTKPANVGSLDISMQRIRDELIPRIKALCGWAAESGGAGGTSRARRAKASGPRQVAVVAIGASTGGPNALAEVIPRLPAGFPVPIVIVQHMPPVFTRLLAERLSQKSGVRVVEAAENVPLRAGQAYIAPGDHHLAVRRRTGSVHATLSQEPPENSVRPAADVLFRSVAEVYGDGVLAVVLTGMGKDGLRGCEAIDEAGGQILAQDEASSVVWGMPGFVARAGLADRLLPLEEIAAEIAARVGSATLRPTAAGS